MDTGKVEGWDDPRMPTLRGILRRGLKVETLTEFMLAQGPSKNSNLMEWDKLWAINQKHLDPVCTRYVGISKEKVSTLKILNGSELETFSVLVHP